jgi:methionyl-tRNA synthetase
MPKPAFYVTTAIDYPNAKPHIGHAYEKIVADCLARWHRLAGDDVFFLTGTDEHGQKLERAAAAAGQSPQAFVDGMVAHFRELCRALEVTNDGFVRTTDPGHVQACQSIWRQVAARGDIYRGTYEGWYCTGCEAYYTEKDAPGNECPTHRKPLERLKEESYFFRLGKYQDAIIEHIRKHPEFIQPESRRHEILNRLGEGLKDLSVSRASFSWGIPVPGDTRHVIYVWFDALLNYISGIGYPGPRFRQYWPASVHIIGKDIIWFHAVIWPAILRAAGLPLPRTVHAHGHLTVNGEKMSKSLGNVIDPLPVVRKYGSDAVRYHLLRDVVAGEDGDYNEATLVSRANGDLADGLGNLAFRVATLIESRFAGEFPKPGARTEAEQALIRQANLLAEELDALMHQLQWHKALEKLYELVHACNKYITAQEPWKATDIGRLGTILYTLVECLRIISILSEPFTPGISARLRALLGLKPGTLKDAVFRETTRGKVGEKVPVFKKIEVVQSEDPFSRLDLRVGRVEEVRNHPDAEKLYVLRIDLGTEVRQLVAGLRQYLAPGELKGRQVVIIANLKPARFRGVESQGMLLAAEKDGRVQPLQAPNSPPGSPVSVDGIPREPAGQVTIEQFQKIAMTVADGQPLYRGKPLRTPIEDIEVEIADGATIR